MNDTTDTSSSAPKLNTSVVFYGIVAVGLVVISDYAPRLINGLLALILIGLVLRNSHAIQLWISNAVHVST